MIAGLHDADRTDDDRNFIAQALPAFISEAREQVAALELSLLQLDTAPHDRELLDALFRCAHTIKGSAGMFGLDALVSFTHHVETLLDALREGRRVLTPEIGVLLLQANDQILALVEAASGCAAEAAGDAAARAGIAARLMHAAGGAPASADPAPADPRSVQSMQEEAGFRDWRVAVAFGRDTFRHGMDPLAILDYVRKLGTIDRLTCDAAAVPPLEALDPEDCHLAFEFDLRTAAPLAEIEAAFSFVRDDCVLSIAPCADAPQGVPSVLAPHPVAEVGPAMPVDPAGKPLAGTQAPAPAVATGLGDDNRFIRIPADRLDEVIDLLGELVTAGAGACLLAREIRHPRLTEAHQQITRLIEEVRNSTLQLRMVPVGETFTRFRRVVRTIAAELGKEVALEIVGGDTELDKSVVERIADPLTHLVRNALDHGLETSAERLAASKPAQGRLTLSACHEAGGILIRIIDDGRGIRRDKVLQRARERGLLAPGVVPADEDLLKLVFEPGFSTAEKVTNLSGRGVGMDVVRRNIEALRGSVTISSVAGAGSCIEIRLPLTLAIIDGFLVSVGRSKFIFPLESVVEVIESGAGESAARTPGPRRSAGHVDLRGQMLPIVDPRELYGLDAAASERDSVVVVRANAGRFGVRVDGLLGQHQAVIKPLGRMFRGLGGMSGSSILGSGEVALIFDVNSLSALAAAAPSMHSQLSRDIQ